MGQKNKLVYIKWSYWQALLRGNLIGHIGNACTWTWNLTGLHQILHCFVGVDLGKAFEIHRSLQGNTFFAAVVLKASRNNCKGAYICSLLWSNMTIFIWLRVLHSIKILCSELQSLSEFAVFQTCQLKKKCTSYSKKK